MLNNPQVGQHVIILGTNGLRGRIVASSDVGYVAVKLSDGRECVELQAALQPIRTQTPAQTDAIIAAHREWQWMEAQSESYDDAVQDFRDYQAIGAP